MLEGAVYLTAGSAVKHADTNYENNGSAYRNSCTRHEHASKFMRDSDNQLNMITLGNEAVHEESYDLTEIMEKRHEDVVPENSGTECSTNGEYDDRECTRTPDTITPGKNGTVEANSELLADKNITQIKLQEIIVCLEGSDCHVVKDICIDNDLNSHEKILGNTQVSENTIYGFTNATNANDDPSQLMADDAVLVEEDLKLASVVDNDAKNQKASWGLFKNEENLDEGNRITNNTSGKKTSLQQLFDLGEFETDAQGMVPGYDKQDVNQMKIKQATVQEEHSMNLPFGASMTYETNMNSVNPIDDTLKGNLESDHFSARNLPADVAFSNQNGESTENSPNDQAEVIFTSDFKTAAAVVISGAEENGANTDDLQSANARYYSVSKKTVPNAATTSTSDQSSLYYNSHGDLNFSGPCLSGPRITSGHIAYSGSISLRSDSSTTSSRSFAFPILQREWSRSPVKMAKADRRHSRGRWTLFCCHDA